MKYLTLTNPIISVKIHCYLIIKFYACFILTIHTFGQIITFTTNTSVMCTCDDGFTMIGYHLKMYKEFLSSCLLMYILQFKLWS